MKAGPALTGMSLRVACLVGSALRVAVAAWLTSTRARIAPGQPGAAHVWAAAILDQVARATVAYLTRSARYATPTAVPRVVAGVDAPAIAQRLGYRAQSRVDRGGPIGRDLAIGARVERDLPVDLRAAVDGGANAVVTAAEHAEDEQECSENREFRHALGTLGAVEAWSNFDLIPHRPPEVTHRW